MSTQEGAKHLADFFTQAVVGVHMAFFRQLSIPHNQMDAQTLNQKQVAFARYLNSTWRSMIVKDDEFITESFDNIFRCLPYESPVCILYLLFECAQKTFQMDITIGSSSPPSQQTPQNQAYVDCLRNVLSSIVKDASLKDLEAYLEKEHNCTGVKYENLGGEDPDSDFFKFSS